MISQHTIFGDDGIACGYRIAGTAERTVVFVHGVGSTAAIWDRQLDVLSNEFRCVAVDLRGNGIPQPEPPAECITPEGFARDVLAVADVIGVEQFDFVGCSLGGVVGFELARMAGERLRSLCILGGFARYPDADAYAERVIQTVRSVGSMREFAELRAAQLGLPADRLHETIEQMACKQRDSYEAATITTWTQDYRGTLSAIGVPTLVAYGQGDTVAPAALSEEIAGGIRGARLVEISDAGHVANADNPLEFNAVLREFLATI
ncbi:MAG: alpha/beta fold hydrolase [Vulcanimicrobiaceae bacterium]